MNNEDRSFLLLLLSLMVIGALAGYGIEGTAQAAACGAAFGGAIAFGILFM